MYDCISNLILIWQTPFHPNSSRRLSSIACREIWSCPWNERSGRILAFFKWCEVKDSSPTRWSSFYCTHDSPGGGLCPRCFPITHAEPGGRLQQPERPREVCFIVTPALDMDQAYNIVNQVMGMGWQVCPSVKELLIVIPRIWLWFWLKPKLYCESPLKFHVLGCGSPVS